MPRIEVLRSLSWQHVAVAFAVYFTCVAFYRLYLHPLAKFPGPKLAALTRLYEAYYDVILDGQYTFKIEKLHKKYGPVVRISPYELHVGDPAFFEKLYTREGRWDKYAWAQDAFGFPLTAVHTWAHDVHKRRRTAMNAYFSKANVSRRQDVIKSLVEKLCGRFDEAAETQEAINLTHALSAFARDLSIGYILRKDYGNLDAKDFNASMTKTVMGLGKSWLLRKHAGWATPLILNLPSSLTGIDGTAAFRTFVQSAMRDIDDTLAGLGSRENPVDTPLTSETLVHSIMWSGLPDAEKAPERVRQEVTGVLGAAFESTAAAMRLILYYVYSDAAILGRLRAELQAAGGSETLDWSGLEQLPYLTAVLYEGLRLSPGLATRSARVPLDRDLVYGQWLIPRGTPVGMTSLLMHRDERLYPDPLRFNPDRWLSSASRMKLDKTFVPFSRGTRNCTGMQLAWAELYLVIANVVQQFDFDFIKAGPEDVMPVADNFTVGMGDNSGIRTLVVRRL
ncbi:trichodiene oxygenase [Staphylotrichum tortipilum]|uniref:Trichodiene oxygenase n=1 Tax=Staphylotrichum tortipilum TaxID=2831512 RepID=A0AAN6MC95_9PEZI|nr:trichodiene oxygenase [Staphylotrichum longicolle]